MNLNQIAERIAYDKGQPFNIMLLENIKFSIRYWRALLIRRDVAANGMSDELLQRGYLDLVKVDKADACNFDLGQCSTILRTKNQIPQLVRIKSDVLFKFVGSVDGKPFTYTEYEEVPYTCYNRFTSSIVRYSYINNYLYFFNNTKLKKAAIQAIFVDPYQINNLCDDNCYDDNSEFPCPADLVQAIVAGITTGELKVMNKDEQVDIDQDTIK